jgi:hypothetical protein
MAFVHGLNWYNNVRHMAIKVRIKGLESVTNTVFNRNYRGGHVKWIQDYEDAFTELALLGQRGKRLGMMMKSRGVALYRMPKISV